MKKTIFISSTYEDLKDERKSIWEMLKNFDVDIRGMEQFGARKEDSLTVCLKEVEQSDIYLGIIGFNYGSVDRKTRKSYTQLEYEHALKLDLEILIYFMDESDSKITPSLIDFKNHESLEIFKNNLKRDHTIDTFNNSTDLVQKLERQIKKHVSSKKKEIITDDYQNSLDILNRFFLIPKAYNGKEIKLKIKFNGEPFSISKRFADIFKLEYGKTIGYPIKILNPKVNADNLNNIIIEYKFIDKILEIDKEVDYEVFANIYFNENKVKDISAEFRDITYFVYEVDDPMDMYDDYYRYHRTKEGEGQIILKLKEIIS
ncbi:DUF4062 domain-containing protein [candidate division KSB1 bacterium]